MRLKPAVADPAQQPATVEPQQPAVADPAQQPATVGPQQPAVADPAQQPTTVEPQQPAVADPAQRPETVGPQQPAVADPAQQPATVEPQQPAVVDPAQQPATVEPQQPAVSDPAQQPATVEPQQPAVADPAQRNAILNHLQLPWKPVLSGAQLKRGLSYYGTGQRIEHFVAKLIAGHPVTAVSYYQYRRCSLPCCLVKFATATRPLFDFITGHYRWKHNLWGRCYRSQGHQLPRQVSGGHVATYPRFGLFSAPLQP